MRKHDWLALVGWVALCEGAGAVGAYFTTPNLIWYSNLLRPTVAPPNWVFGPVWITLYLLMGVAAYIVWRHRYNDGLRVFGLQLALNVLWSAVFFGLRSLALGFAVIVLLWAAIIWTIIAFDRRSARAAELLLPYLGWVTFAGYLNFLLWTLN